MNENVSNYIDNISFKSYSDKDIEKLSIVEIFAPKALDKDFKAIPHGPHDLALGPIGFDDACITCGLNYYLCPGHMGHIHLPMPIYNPMLFKTLYIIIKGSCIYCYKLLAPKIQTLLIRTQMELFEYGIESVVNDLNEIINRTPFVLTKAEESSLNQKNGAENYFKNIENQFNSYKTKFMNDHSKKFIAGQSPSKNITELRGSIIKDYLKRYHLSNLKTCPYCHLKLPSVKIKDGSKICVIFSKKVASKQPVYDITNLKETLFKNPNDENTLDSKSTMNSLIWTNSAIKGEQILMPVEVKNILQNVFDIQDQYKTLASLFGLLKVNEKLTRKNDMNIFFINFLPVIPSKFRPMNTLGDSKFVGGQTLIYTKILAACQLLRETMHATGVEGHPNLVTSDATTTSQNTTSLDPKNRSALQRFKYNTDRRSRSSMTSTTSGQRPLPPPDKVASDQASVRDKQAFLMVWQYLQACVNLLIEPDEELFPKEKLKGIKQILEKKEGLFRKHMMGKRVNFAARSVISPDPYIRVDEIGVPQIFARKLTFPEPITERNVERLRRAIINGPANYPGAFSVTNPDGSTTFLNPKRPEQRLSIARQLMAPLPPTHQSTGRYGDGNVSGSTAPNPVRIVHRHLMDSDVLLLNRQPTLHKPSIMAHKARVLPGEKTLRLHYAHCKAYNADFDGDEMNAHLPQSLLGRSEGLHLSGCHLQYLGPKDGAPLTGLIQDHLIAAVGMTVRGRFFPKSDFQNLVYAALSRFSGVRDNAGNAGIRFPSAAILKPYQLWSGKQIISTILLNIVPRGHEPLNLYGKAKIKEDLWRQKFQRGACKTTYPPTPEPSHMSENRVIVRQGDWLSGVFDKAHFGASPFGLVHCCQELYGGQVANDILTALGRVFTAYLQISGFTLGIKDILITTKGDKVRKKYVKEGRTQVGVQLLKEVFGSPKTGGTGPETSTILKERWERAFVTKDERLLQEWESASKRCTDTINNQISEYIMSKGLLTSFPGNNLLLMVHSGAKGTLVNCMQICCLLGQIELEGRRPPMLVTGRTLPSFLPYDPTPRAHGFIDYRFLSGLKPQDYFFHCMAGREGLIDTAVKTSHSGYLQRCIIKHLEGLKVSYDSTVRDSDGSVVQFLYGEDGLEVTKSQFLKNVSEIDFLLSNHGITAPHNEIEAVKGIMDKENIKSLKREKKKRLSQKIKIEPTEDGDKPGSIKSVMVLDASSLPLLSQYSPAKTFGSISNVLQSLTDGYKPLYDRAPFYSRKHQSTSSSSYPLHDFPRTFKSLENVVYLKSLKSMVEPGEAVGLLCAQSIGEPSTQMTLNTFHFAGRGEMNVTLGIPRLREILMTATRNLKTPMMCAPFHLTVANKPKKIQKISRHFAQIYFSQVIMNAQVEESVFSNTLTKFKEVYWVYRIKFNLLPYKAIKKILPTTCDKHSVLCAIERHLLPKMVRSIKKEDSCLNNIKLFESRKKMGVFLEGTGLPSQTSSETIGSDSAIPGEDDVTDRTEFRGKMPGGDRESSSSSSSSSSDEDGDEERGGLDRVGSGGDYSGAESNATTFNPETAASEYESERDDKSSAPRSSSGFSDMEEDDIEGDGKVRRAKRKLNRSGEDDGLGTDDAELATQSGTTSSSKKLKAGSSGAPKKMKAKQEIPFSSQSDRERIKNVLEGSSYIAGYSYDTQEELWCEATLHIPLSENKIDMEALLEREIKSTLFYNIPGVVSSFVTDPDPTTQRPSLQIQGINLPEILRYGKFLDLTHVYCNDLHQILETYGIEACRNAIIKEVQKVFSAYGIQVDYRHLSLVADYMTFDGYYRPFNRYTMANQVSPFLKMSFESTFSFLQEALVSGVSDDLETPTARIVMGREIKTGTGCFDLRHSLL